MKSLLRFSLFKRLGIARLVAAVVASEGLFSSRRFSRRSRRERLRNIGQHDMIPFTKFPFTSVRRKSRPA
jgi:hypothetical protein